MAVHLSIPSRLLLAGASIAAALALTAPADAHFVLEAPGSWMSQDVLGSPQKLGPCGDETGGTATATVTPFQAGDTVTITLDETIFHPGHYRVALAVHDRSELPPEPTVTPDSTPCGSVPIQDPPVFPVLVDGALVHTAPFSGKQTIQVKLPDGVTCEKCTIQVIEFMSNHPLNNPGGCFYHHCADISITAPDGGAASSSSGTTTSTTTSTSSTTTTGAGGAGGMGGAGGAGGSGGGNESSSSGCGCSMPGRDGPAVAGLGSLLLAMMLLRRRR